MSPCKTCDHIENDKNAPPCSQCMLPFNYARAIHDPYMAEGLVNERDIRNTYEQVIKHITIDRLTEPGGKQLEKVCTMCGELRDHKAKGLCAKCYDKLRKRNKIDIKEIQPDSMLFRRAETVTAQSGGTKHDDGKPRWDLLPFDALEQIVKVYTIGVDKYGEKNWQNGISWRRIFGGIMRHMAAWMLGKDMDDESGLPNLAHAGWGILTLLWYAENRKDWNDR